MLTQEKLKKILYYNSETGEFTNLIHRGPNALQGAKTGSYDAYGYLTIWLNGKSYKTHRLAWLYVTGECPKGDIDHINGAKGDNRFTNLRDVSRSVNISNQGPAVNNYLQVRGVYMDGNKFRVSKNKNGVRYNLGSYDTLEEAREVAEGFQNEI